MKHRDTDNVISIDDQRPISTAHVIDNPWSKLRRYTDARIGLGRSGVSIPTQQLLEFQLAHAQAQDAVHLPLNTEKLTQELQQQGILTAGAQPLMLHSRAADRGEYLQRPDLGRRIDEDSLKTLTAFNQSRAATGLCDAYDLAIVIADGLSSRAVQQNCAPFLAELFNRLKGDAQAWNLAPVSVVSQGRVAVGDEVAELLKARCVLLLVGERPGLSSPDSLGLYLTWAPKVGLTDASRNCISNVRPAGLNYQQAVHKLMYLLNESRLNKLSGVNLKDRSEGQLALSASGDKTDIDKSFLVSD